MDVEQDYMLDRNKINADADEEAAEAAEAEVEE